MDRRYRKFYIRLAVGTAFILAILVSSIYNAITSAQ